MKETVQSSSVYVNISSCIINFKDGRKIYIKGDGDRSLIVSIIEVEATVKSNFRELVLKNYKKAESIPEMAELCGYNCTKTFARHFFKSFNTTPKQWILDMKAEEMLSYLKNTNNSLVEISKKLKFKSLSHFNNFCKKRTGLTPTELRIGNKLLRF